MTSTLSDEEKMVLDVIEEYLGKNRFFNIKDIVPFINSRFTNKSLNINNEGIRIILKSLTNKNYIAEGSKLTKDRILQNQNRRDIYYFVLENPGITINIIVNELHLTPPVVVWHVNTLIKFGCIKKKRINDHDALFHIKIDNKKVKILHLLSKEKCRLIIDYLLKNDNGMSKLELSKTINISRNTVKKYLEELDRFDLVHKIKTPNKILYFLNQENYYKLTIIRR